MGSRRQDITIRQIALETGLEPQTVRNVLKELHGRPVSRETQDRIFKTARKLGYDFRKLKIGKRMQYRKETLEEVREKIEEHPGWSRADILAYLKESRALVDRVHKRVFKDEFGEEPR